MKGPLLRGRRIGINFRPTIDKANDALRFYKEALRYADDGKETSKRDEGAFIKRQKKKEYDYNPE